MKAVLYMYFKAGKGVATRLMPEGASYDQIREACSGINYDVCELMPCEVVDMNLEVANASSN